VYRWRSFRPEPRLAEAPFEIKWRDLPSGEISLDEESADTVLLT
jgi:hypothetical protein